MSEDQPSEQDMLDKIRAALAKDMKIIFEKATPPTLIYSILNVYLQMQMLDTLERIDTNIADVYTRMIEGKNTELESFSKQFKEVVLTRYGVALSDDVCKQEYDEINRALHACKEARDER